MGCDFHCDFSVDLLKTAAVTCAGRAAEAGPFLNVLWETGHCNDARSFSDPTGGGGCRRLALAKLAFDSVS